MNAIQQAATIDKDQSMKTHWTFIFGPHFFLGLNTMLYSYLLYQTKLVPQWLAVWGLIGAAMMFIVTLFEIPGVIPPSWVAPLAMPIALFEMALAVWLIAKGFNLSAIADKVPGTISPEVPLVSVPVTGKSSRE